MKVELRGSKQIEIETDYEEKERIKSQATRYKWSKAENVWILPLSQFRNLDIKEDDFVSEDVREAFSEKYEKDVEEINTDLLDDDIELYDFQKPLAKDLASKNGFLSALDMGLGKTAISIASSVHKIEEDGVEHVLVVAPASLRYQWAEEVIKFTSEEFPDPVIIKGSNFQRVKRETGERVNLGDVSFDDIFNKSPAKIYITSYTTLSRKSVPLDQYQFGIMVADEASKLKNHESKRTKMAKKIIADNKWALSGTPIEKSAKDLYNIIDFVDSGYLGRYKQFKKKYLITETKRYGRRTTEKVVGHKNLDFLREQIDDIVHRKKKEEVLDDLPNLTIKKRTVEMDKDQKTVHNEIMETMKERVKKKQSVGGLATYVQMACNSTKLLNKSEKFSETVRDNDDLDIDLPLEEENPKIGLVEKVKNTAEKEDKKILAFTTHKDFAYDIADELGCEVLTGDHKSENRDRVLEKEKRKDGHSMLIMTDILSYGANLQEFDLILNVDLPWTAAKLSQRIDRIRRIGREKPVTCINLVTENSFEEKIDEVVQNRQKIFDNFFDENSEITNQEDEKMIEEVVEMV